MIGQPILGQEVLAPLSGILVAVISTSGAYLVAREQSRKAHERAARAEAHATKAETKADDAKITAERTDALAATNTSRLDALATDQGVMSEMRGLIERQQSQLVSMAQTTAQQLERSTMALLECERGRETQQRQIDEMRVQANQDREESGRQHRRLEGVVRALQGELARLRPDEVAPPAPGPN